MQQPLAFIPSPADGVWHLGFVPIRGYAIMIIIGVIVAVWLTERRWIAQGGQQGAAIDVAVWAVPFGLIGGRVYHVITDWQLYFGTGGSPLDAVMIWKGGLGIWGAISIGAIGAYIGCRQRGISLRAFADAAAPGIVLAQGIGRWGNWFNQELFGRPTSLPWGLEIDPGRAGSVPGELTYHPTFLYEFLWCVGVAALVIWAERRYQLGYGRTFALYVAAYTVGRFWIELLRIDQAHEVFGMRLNNWTSIVVFLGAVAYLLIYRGRQTTQLVVPATAAAVPATVGAAGAATEAEDEDEVQPADDASDDVEEADGDSTEVEDDEREDEPAYASSDLEHDEGVTDHEDYLDQADHEDYEDAEKPAESDETAAYEDYEDYSDYDTAEEGDDTTDADAEPSADYDDDPVDENLDDSDVETGGSHERESPKESP